jgi:hypothetical protein
LVTKSCTLDRIDVRADDDNGVSDAGLLVAATLGQRLGLDALLREHLTVPGSAGAHPDQKCLTLIHSLLAGGDCIEDVNALRAGCTGAVLGHRVAASSTVGTFLRAFGFGHARQLDVVSRRLLTRAVAAGAHPGFAESVTVDIDSTLCETYGLGKDGARGVMRTGRRGYHPLLAVVAGTGDIAGVVAHVVCGVAGPATPPAHRCLSRRPSTGSGKPALPVRSCCAPTPGSTSPTWSPPAAQLMSGSPSPPG